MQIFVLGFLFSPSLDEVVLLKKNRPPWQKGYLNGVGGHVEQNESPLEAMNREAKEKFDYTGHWTYFGRIENKISGGLIDCFYSIFPNENLDVKSNSDEKAMIVITESIIESGLEGKKPMGISILPNVPLLIAAAMTRIRYNSDDNKEKDWEFILKV